MRRLAGWKQWLLILLVAPAASLAAYHLGSLSAVALRQQDHQTPLPTVNGLYIDPASLDLGEVWETPQHQFRLKIRNTGSATQTISRFPTTCGCLKLDPPQRTIASGEEAEFTCNLDLTHRQPYEMGLARRPVSVRLDPVFEGDFSPMRGWEVKCVALSRVTVSTAQLAFGDRCCHEGPRVWQKVRAKTHIPLKNLQASVPPESAAVRIETDAANREDFFLFVSPNPSLPIGRFRFQVLVQAVMPDGTVHPCVTIAASGEMQPTSQVAPRMVLLGEHTVSSQAEADVTLRLPAKDWKIDHIETDSPDTLVIQGKDELAEGVRLHIKQRIGQPGDQVSKIRIAVRKPDSQVEIVTVEVRYYGQSGPR